MNSPEEILNMNIARYRELLRAEKDPQFRLKLEEALARDLKTKDQPAESTQSDD